MKIQDSSGIGRAARTGSPAAPVRRPSAPHTGGQDRIDVSADARRVAGLAEEARRMPELRHDRVEELRRALAEGTYRVDSRAVARAILEFEADLAR